MFCIIISHTSGFYGLILWYSENKEKNTLILFRDPNWEKKIQFGVDADIYITKNKVKFWCL